MESENPVCAGAIVFDWPLFCHLAAQLLPRVVVFTKFSHGPFLLPVNPHFYGNPLHSFCSFILGFTRFYASERSSFFCFRTFGYSDRPQTRLAKPFFP